MNQISRRSNRFPVTAYVLVSSRPFEFSWHVLPIRGEACPHGSWPLPALVAPNPHHSSHDVCFTFQRFRRSDVGALVRHPGRRRTAGSPSWVAYEASLVDWAIIPNEAVASPALPSFGVGTPQEKISNPAAQSLPAHIELIIALLRLDSRVRNHYLQGAPVLVPTTQRYHVHL